MSQLLSDNFTIAKQNKLRMVQLWRETQNGLKTTPSFSRLRHTFSGLVTVCVEICETDNKIEIAIKVKIIKSAKQEKSSKTDPTNQVTYLFTVEFIESWLCKARWRTRTW